MRPGVRAATADGCSATAGPAGKAEPARRRLAAASPPAPVESAVQAAPPGCSGSVAPVAPAETAGSMTAGQSEVRSPLATAAMAAMAAVAATVGCCTAREGPVGKVVSAGTDSLWSRTLAWIPSRSPLQLAASVGSGALAVTPDCWAPAGRVVPVVSVGFLGLAAVVTARTSSRLSDIPARSTWRTSAWPVEPVVMAETVARAECCMAMVALAGKAGLAEPAPLSPRTGSSPTCRRPVATAGPAEWVARQGCSVPVGPVVSAARAG